MAPGARRSVLDARGEEETADEDVTWNVNVYAGEGSGTRELLIITHGERLIVECQQSDDPFLTLGAEEETADENVIWNASVYEESSCKLRNFALLFCQREGSSMLIVACYTKKTPTLSVHTDNLEELCN